MVGQTSGQTDSDRRMSRFLKSALPTHLRFCSDLSHEAFDTPPYLTPSGPLHPAPLHPISSTTVDYVAPCCASIALHRVLMQRICMQQRAMFDMPLLILLQVGNAIYNTCD